MEKEILNCVTMFSYFDDWEPETLRELCKVAKINSYKAEEIVFGTKRDFKTYIYFIIEGSCKVVGYLLSRRGTKVDLNNNDKNAHLIDIYLLYRLACFNVGENLHDKIVMAIEETKCLLIPYLWLFDHNHCNIWPRLTYYLNFNLPNVSQIQRHLFETRKWEQFKKKLIREKFKRKFLCHDINKIPYSLRIESS